MKQWPGLVFSCGDVSPTFPSSLGHSKAPRSTCFVVCSRRTYTFWDDFTLAVFISLDFLNIIWGGLMPNHNII